MSEIQFLLHITRLVMATTDVLTSEDEFELVFIFLAKECGITASDISKLTFIWALRISDLLSLRWSMVEEGIRRGKFKIVEQKTKKTNIIYLDEHSKSILSKMRLQQPANEFLFQSRRKGAPRPIVRQTVYHWMKKLQSKINGDRRLRGEDEVNLGTHTMRKIAARMRYEENKDLAAAQQLLNHADPKTTISYLGLGEEDRKKIFEHGSEILKRKKF